MRYKGFIYLTLFLVNISVKSKTFGLLSLVCFIVGYSIVVSTHLPAAVNGELAAVYLVATIIGALSPLILLATLGQVLLKERLLNLDVLLKSYRSYKQYYIASYVCAGITLSSLIALLCLFSLVVIRSAFFGISIEFTLVDICTLLLICISNAIISSLIILPAVAVFRSAKSSFLVLMVFYTLIFVVPKLSPSIEYFKYILDPFNTRFIFDYLFLKKQWLTATFEPLHFLKILGGYTWQSALFCVCYLLSTLPLKRITVGLTKTDDEPVKKSKESNQFCKAYDRVTEVKKTPSYYQVFELASFDIKYHFASNAFKSTIVLCGLVLCWSLSNVSSLELDLSYRASNTLAKTANGLYSTMISFVVTFYVGVSVFREKNSKFLSLFLSYSLGRVAFITSKILSGIALVLLAKGLALSIAFLYAFVYLSSPDYLAIFAAIALQTIRLVLLVLISVPVFIIVGRQYLALSFIFLLLILDVMAYQWGFEFFVIGLLPTIDNTALNGYDGQVAIWFALFMYWVVIFSLTFILAVNTSKKPTKLPLKYVTLVYLALTIVVLGSHSLFVTENDADKGVTYLQKYGKYANIPQPIVTGVKANVDVSDTGEYVEIKSVYTVFNDNESVINQLILDVPSEVEIIDVGDVGKPIKLDNFLGFWVIELFKPIREGERLSFSIFFKRTDKVLSNNWQNLRVKKNSMFISTQDSFPKIGFNRDKVFNVTKVELSNRSTVMRDRNYLLNGSFSRIDYHAIISVPKHHFALTSGELVNQWKTDKRHYYEYQSKSPIAPLIPIISGQYLRKSIEGEELRVSLLTKESDGSKRTKLLERALELVDFFNHSFGGALLNRLTIAEVDLRHDAGIAFPNVIALSSVNALIDRKGINGELTAKEFLVLAHEIAHQWWGLTFMPQKNHGTKIFVESLAQYSALLALKEHFAQAEFERIIKEHQDRASNIAKLQNVSLFSEKATLPAYYFNGAVGFWALRERVGDEALEKALKQLIQDKELQSSPSVEAIFNHLDNYLPTIEKESIKEFFNN